MTRRTTLTPVQAALLRLGRRVYDRALAEAEAEFAALQRLVIEDMDVPSDATGTFEQQGETITFVELVPEEAV